MKIRIFCLLYLLIAPGFVIAQQDRIAEIKNIISLDGEDFFKALNELRYDFLFDSNNKSDIKTSYTLSDTLNIYWLLIEKIINSKPKNFDERYPGMRALEDIFYDMLSRSSDTEYQKLLDYYSGLPDTSIFKDDTFLIPLCNYWIKREIDHIINNNVQPGLNPVFTKDFEIPSSINHLPSDLKDTWYLFKSFEASYSDRINQDTSCQWYYVQKNYDIFFNEIKNILKSESVGNHMKEILRFTWGGWCGTGSEYFYTKQQTAILILLLKERNYHAILGNLRFTDNIGYKNFNKLIELCGYDWIDYYTGAMLDEKWWQTTPYFTKIGGVKAANILLTMKEYNFEKIYGNAQYLSLCNRFLQKDKENKSRYNLSWYSNPFFEYEFSADKDSTIEVPDEIKDKLRTTIIELVKCDTSIGISQQAISLFYNFPFNSEIKEILLTYTNSSFKSVRDGAAKILKENGIEPDLPEDNGLVVFRVLLDNIPLNKFLVGYELCTDSTKYGYSTSSSLKSTDEGIISFKKDLLLSMIKPVQKIRFTSNLFSSDIQKTAFFCTDVKMPNNLFDTTDVLIFTGKLNLKFNFNRNKEFYKNKEMQIYLSNSNCSLSNIQFTTPIKEIYSFPQRIQKGKYYLSISMPGSTDWREFFEINDDTTNLTVNLLNGTDVLFKIEAPGGEIADEEVMFDLICNSSKDKYFFEPYDYFLPGYVSLPEGNYTLKILSSEEKKAKISQYNATYCKEIIKEFSDYSGKEINFTIDKNTPETIDLGTIKLEPKE